MELERDFPETKKDPQKNVADKSAHTHEAFEQAEKDIENDPEWKTDENEDLDEGELARKEGHP